MSNSIFEYDDYRPYLLDYIAFRDGTGRGYRSQLASELGVQRTFISQVLGGDAHFNLEHADRLSEILGHLPEEADFLLLLVNYTRAGTTSLRKRLQQQITNIREHRRVLKNRFKEKDGLSLEDKMRYYSSWLYGAIRVLATIPEYQSRSKIFEYFNLPAEQINTALEFLLSRHLLKESEDGTIASTEKHMFLGNDTALIAKHHGNWRSRAIQSLDFERKSDLHFSAVNSLSREDVELIRETLAQTIAKVREKVKDSKEECLYAICMDLFEV